MAKKKKSPEVTEAESIIPVGDLDVAATPAEAPQASDVDGLYEEESAAAPVEEPAEIAADDSAIAALYEEEPTEPEAAPVEEAPVEEAPVLEEVEALSLDEVTEAPEEAIAAEAPVEEPEAIDVGVIDALYEEPALSEPAPVEAVAVVAESDKGEIAVEDVIENKEVEAQAETVAPEKPAKHVKEAKAANVEAPVVVAAAPILAPDYNTRLMRRERDGYAGSFRLAEGETVLSMWRAIKGKGTDGRVYLTNERCLIEAALHTEFPIGNVAGTGKYSRLKVFKFLLGLVFMAVCVVAVLLALPSVLEKILPDFAATMSGVYEDMGWIKYVLFAVGGILGLIGLIMVCKSVSHRFVLTVFTEGVDQAFSVRSGVNKGDINVYQPIAFGAPGKDYKAFISQVGARLIEIKRAKGGK